MLNFHIRKVILKSGDTRYRTVITKSGKGIKTKTFRRKADAKTWGSRTILEHQENEAKGINPCTVTISQLTDEYMHWWAGKDRDRVRLVLWWEKQLGLLPPINFCRHTGVVDRYALTLKMRWMLKH